MSKDEFIEATTDVWEIAGRARHPGRAPGPVPRRAPAAAHRALHLPRTTSSSTPSWARARPAWPPCGRGRHYVGYDTEPTYVRHRRTARSASERDRLIEAATRTPSSQAPARPAPAADAERGRPRLLEPVRVHRRGRRGKRHGRRRRRRPTRRTRPHRADSGSSTSSGPSPPPAPGCGGPTRCGRRWARRPCIHAASPEIPLVLLTTGAPVAGQRRRPGLAVPRRGGPDPDGIGAVYDVIEIGFGRRRGPAVPLRVARARAGAAQPHRRAADAAPTSRPTALPVPDDRTTVTELATALGTLGLRRPAPPPWRGARPSWTSPRPPGTSSSDLHDSGTFAAEFATAFANGRAFLEAARRLAGTAAPPGRVDGGPAAPG